MNGKVYIVGAGPGDPDLLTLRAAALLGEADVIVKDALASDSLLAFASPEVEVIRAGKRYGDHRMKQDQIQEILVTQARAGKTVVRLKGGDPFVFGRGGEEAQALARAGIPFEVVPGITSAAAVPAYAGIPLTHREHARSFAVITGHVGAHDHGAQVQWERLAEGAGTIVFLMGVTRLADNVARLIAAGRSKETPVAVIRWGATPRQQTIVATLETVCDEIERAGMTPPAVVVIGDVVSLRAEIDWFERLPLFGKRVLVTRPAHQQASFVEKLRRLGAEPLAIPTIEVTDPDSYQPLDRAIAELDRYDQLVFTSRNGVEFFWRRLLAAGGDARRLAGLRVATIGPGTANALAARGVRSDLQGREFKAEGLSAEMIAAGVDGARILIARAAKARQVLIDDLRAAGATVEVVAAYQTVVPDTAAERLRDLGAAGGIDVVTFTSASTVTNLFDVLGDDDVHRLVDGAVVACIGPITRGAALGLGLHCDVTASEYTIDGLCQALIEHFHRQGV